MALIGATLALASHVARGGELRLAEAGNGAFAVGLDVRGHGAGLRFTVTPGAWGRVADEPYSELEHLTLESYSELGARPATPRRASSPKSQIHRGGEYPPSVNHDRDPWPIPVPNPFVVPSCPEAIGVAMGNDELGRTCYFVIFQDGNFTGPFCDKVAVGP